MSLTIARSIARTLSNGTWAYSPLVIDCQHALPLVERRPGVTLRAKMMMGQVPLSRRTAADNFGLALRWQRGKGAIRQVIVKTKSIDEGEILSTHPYFTYRCQEPVNLLRLLFGFQDSSGKPETREGPLKNRLSGLCKGGIVPGSAAITSRSARLHTRGGVCGISSASFCFASLFAS